MPEPNPKHADLKLLLLQIRESEEVAEHELASILDVTGLPEYAFWTWNMALEGDLRWERVAAADGVVIGGAGVHSATHDDPFVPNLIDTVRRLAEERKPTFGSCYGHQIIARALGGEVVTDEERSETGCNEITLTEACQGDPIFGDLWMTEKRTFPVLMGHRDRVSLLPETAVELARSEVCPFQAYRVGDRPMWATQFHSELTPERLMERLERYADIYAPGDDTIERLRASMKPCEEAATLLNRFLDVCAAPEHR